MSALNAALLDQLTAPGSRITELERWLMGSVWTHEAFRSAGNSPRAYLTHGEKQVARRECLLTAAGERFYSELAASVPQATTVAGFLQDNPRSAAVIFDGCSLREIPRLLELAAASGRPVLECGCSRSALPSETDVFVEKRLGFDLPRLGPSQLSRRGEFKDHRVRFYYFRQPGDYHAVEDTDDSLLLWTRFPDQRYTDSTATDASLFDALWDGLELAWKRTVQALPRDRKVLVTSDHGYVFLHSGFSDPNLKGVDKVLNGKRLRFFEDGEDLPVPAPGLWVDGGQRFAVIAGRAHNRPQAPSASQSVYRHGGLSIMECITPWIVLGPVSQT